ncbi:gamma-glutamyl-gamma-aminobutyrate hydrolase family protein [Streptococcus pyogenes]|uniref:gamma-glutamyl-gamma-aminobutyrate hydrolase family protein n=1 Tax=Streptococcus pyogenes TaxID=1314 RepID=UPI00109C416C|nr:gamma-glutamyl-gamma-aminobutyrate hydrolase family protein [Streptococcus pyogenes]VGV09167.1 peptidase C26 family protein [Streptococcus pyogenes]
MTKPIIGITANQRLNMALDNLPWSYAPTGFVQAVTQSGGLPLLLPIGDEAAAKTYVSMVDKIILIGGQNVDPKYYQEEKAAFDDDFSPERDTFELAIIKEAITLKKPILGICRGTQLMNVALGGNLNQHIDSHWQEAPSDFLSHEMIIEPDSILYPIYGHKTLINSFHRQSLKTVAKDLKVIARDSRDGTIEAVISTNDAIPFLGVQWHPELLQGVRDEDLQLFRLFVNDF